MITGHGKLLFVSNQFSNNDFALRPGFFFSLAAVFALAAEVPALPAEEVPALPAEEVPALPAAKVNMDLLDRFGFSTNFSLFP